LGGIQVFESPCCPATQYFPEGFFHQQKFQRMMDSQPTRDLLGIPIIKKKHVSIDL
jgi:hypothetical protein